MKYWDPGVSLVYPPEWINATLVPQETVGGFSFSVPVRVLPACRVHRRHVPCFRQRSGPLCHCCLHST